MMRISSSPFLSLPLQFCLHSYHPQVPSSTSLLSHSKPEVGGNSTAQVVYIWSCPLLPRPGFGCGGGRHGGVVHVRLSSLSPTRNPPKELLDLAKSGRRSQTSLSLQIFTVLAKAASPTCECFPTWLCGSRPPKQGRKGMFVHADIQSVKEGNGYAPKHVKTPGKGEQRFDTRFKKPSSIPL